MAGQVLWCSQAGHTAVMLLLMVVVLEESVMRRVFQVDLAKGWEALLHSAI